MATETTPRVFNSITRFSVAGLEKVDVRLDRIIKLTLEFESKLPPGRHTFVLIRPFAPFGRAGTALSKLTSLPSEDIESISIFPESGNERRTRMEIIMKDDERSVVDCQAIEVPPDHVQSCQPYRALPSVERT